MKLNYIILGILILIILGVFFINHPKKRDAFIDNNPPPTKQYREFPENITLSFSESFNTTGGYQILLRLYTVRGYTCYDYKINADVEIQEDVILVNIKGISSSKSSSKSSLIETCPTISAPAHFSKNLGGEIEGNYLVIIRYEDKEDKYNLSITKEEIRVKTISSSFTVLRNKDVLKRFPLGTIKVSCSKKADDPHESLCDQFYKDLESLGATKSNKEYAKQLSRTHSVLYDYSGNLTALKNLVDKYSQYDYMIIKVYTPREYFHS